MECNLKYLFFIGLSFIGFHLPISYGGRGSDVSKRERIVDKVLLKASKTIEREAGIVCIGTGGGTMHGVEMLALSFQHKGKLDIAKAREKVIQAGEIFLGEINSCEELKKYLKPCPFTGNNIEIRIIFVNTDQRKLPADKLQSVSSTNGVLRYYIDHPDKIALHMLATESYEEAKNLVMSKEKAIVTN